MIYLKVQETFPNVKVNKKSCRVKIGDFGQTFSYLQAGMADVVNMANDFLTRGQEEQSQLDIMQKKLECNFHALVGQDRFGICG